MIDESRQKEDTSNMYLILAEPGRRLTSIVDGQEREQYFHTPEAAQKRLDWLDEVHNEQFPEAKIVKVKDYWKWPK